jgi:putative protease
MGSNRIKTELLAPAGSLDKLMLAIRHGADAVYLGGQDYGLRARADNFGLDEIAQGVLFAHRNLAKVYVVLNGFLHQQDMEGIEDYCRALVDRGVDAFIISDLGVLDRVRRLKLPVSLHLSTQASCLNTQAALFWKEQGVDRVILGRENSYQEAQQIREQADIEVEVFIHGSTCMAYSGHCVISNYTQGRDSNRGGCAHSCRFQYDINFSDGQRTQSHFLSAKDLQGPELIGAIVSGTQIDSLKIEGRMKSELYLASVVSAYRLAIDEAYEKQSPVLENETLKRAEELLDWTQGRGKTQGHLGSSPDRESVQVEGHEKRIGSGHAGEIIALEPNEYTLMICKEKFRQGDILSTLTSKGEIFRQPLKWALSLSDELVLETRPNILYKIPFNKTHQVGQIIRWEDQEFYGSH